MKVLHIGFPNPSLGKAFSETSDYRFIDWTAWMAVPNNRESMHNHIRSLSRDFAPDVTFMQIQSPDVITPELCSGLGGTVINWTWDFRDPVPQWMLDVAPHVISAFTNEKDPSYISSLGHRAVFLQGGFDDSVYTPHGPKMLGAPDIVFMANNYTGEGYGFPLTDFRTDIVNSLKSRYGDKFAVYGFGWPGQNPLQSFMHREQKEAECYRGCKIAINLSHYVADRYTSDRMFRILGSGAMCLSHDYPGLDLDFSPGVNLDVWRSKEDLFDQIDKYLANEEARSRVADAGRALAHSKYTWRNMVSKIMDL